MVNGKRVVVMDKVFDCGLFKETIKGVYKAGTSGSPESIKRYVDRQLYFKRNRTLKAAM